MSAKKKDAEKNTAPSAFNRQARHEYHIEYSMEAGMVLKGSEVKSLREGEVQLKEGYAHIRKGEVFLEAVHFRPYSQTTTSIPEPVRSRKLLLHKHEIEKLDRDVSHKAMTLIPLKIYFKEGLAKLQLGVGKGKKLHDKRESIKNRENKRELDRITKKFK